jgi:sec-independent protein translocase protein TatC
LISRPVSGTTPQAVFRPEGRFQKTIVMTQSKDLFDETTMTFGEHLEALRTHLIRGLLGFVVAIALTLTFGDKIMDVIRAPIDQALKRNSIAAAENDVSGFNLWRTLTSYFRQTPHSEKTDPRPQPEVTAVPPDESTIIVHVKPSALAHVLNALDPKRFPTAAVPDNEKAIDLPLSAKEFGEIRQGIDAQHRPITLNVQEAFLTYVKVTIVAALILASPWLFYQIWLFVAAGLYPHERRYVHVYLPMSIGMFIVGVAFCFYLALPMILDFLLSWNTWLKVAPQIVLSDWVTFVILLPLVFGLCFELPLVMLFLERIDVFDVADYRSRRRIAIFLMAVLTLLLCPGGDVGTFLVMFIPMLILYELGIILCAVWKAKRPFEEPAASS